MKTGEIVRLPDGQLVKIEIVHSDGFVSVQRIEGDRAGSLAVCDIAKLERAEPSEILATELAR